MKHLGDITKINGAEVPIVDVVCGGSPCQDLSVAGKRAGLAGERSGLFMEQIRIIKEMRNECIRQLSMRGADEPIRPRYMVWENVPGAFSSNGGKDFHAVLEETAKVAERDASIPGFEGKWPSAGCIMGNGWSIAWRVHDAQFWGVPQRRKRISLVADFGGETAPEILFERKGLSGDIAPGGKEGERVTEDTERCAGETGTEPIVLESNQNHATIQTNGISTALPASAGMGGGYVPMVALITEIKPKIDDDGVAFSLRSRDYKDPQSVCCFEPGAASRVGGHVYENDISGTVRANAGDNQQAVVYGIDQQGGKGMAGYAENVSPTMASDSHGTPHAVCYGISPYDSNGMKSDNPHAGIYKAETARTLDPNGGNPACNQGGIAVVSVENHPADSRVKICDDGKVQALTSRMGTGGGNVPMVMETYQKTTGSLCASAYDKLGTQEAANDMYVVESSSWDGSQVSPTLTANNAGGAQRMPDKENFNAIIQGINGDVAGTLDASYYKGCGERQGTERDVVAYGLDRASFNQRRNAQYDFAVDEEKIGTQVAKGPGAVCENGGIYARTQNQVLRLLSETYGAQEVEKWGIAILATLQSSEILQSGMYESSVSSETKNGYKLDGSSLPCSSVVAGWLLRDMRQREECGCSSQGRKPTEQRFEQSDESMPELSQQNPQACKDLFDMWKKGEGIRLLQQALYQIQKIRRSVDVPGVIVRRLTPLEAERLQGFPDHWTDIGDWVDSKGKKHKGDSDSPRYKALGNSIALPFWQWMAKRMRKYLGDNPTMASLFDGIGGFPLSYSEAGVEPVWASEIEEFPIAVTKLRFPD